MSACHVQAPAALITREKPRLLVGIARPQPLHDARTVRSPGAEAARPAADHVLAGHDCS